MSEHRKALAAPAQVTLDDRYTIERGRAFMSGTQALVRLPMSRRERDRRAWPTTTSQDSRHPVRSVRPHRRATADAGFWSGQ